MYCNEWSDHSFNVLKGSFLNYEYITPMTGFILARIMSDENLIA